MTHGTMFRHVAFCLCAAGLAVGFASPAQAQPDRDFAKQGAVELGGSVAFLSSTPVVDGQAGDATTVFQFSPFVGYFVGDQFELGFNPLSFASSSHSGHSVTQVLILAAPSFNIRINSNVYPFVEGLVGFSSISDGSTADGVTWGFRGGMKIAVTGKGLLNVGLQYLQENLNPPRAVNRYGANEVALVVGFTVWF